MRVKSEKWIEGVKRNYFFGEVTVLNLRMLRERERAIAVYLMALYV